MIRITNLHKRFGSFEALHGFDLHVERGEVYGFLGHNGAGKSTTMNILAGLSRPDSGECIVNGWDLSLVTHPGDLHIGYLPEQPGFYPWMTGRETLQYLGSTGKVKSGPDRRMDKWVDKRVDEMLSWVGLTDAAKRRVGGYSRGMKQRLGMAAALFHDADLLLLDEPSSALDPEGRSEVLRLILDLKSRGKTVFLSTHILSDVERVCDRVGILVKGNMVTDKPLKDLYAQNVQSVYDVELLEGIPDPEMVADLHSVEGVRKVESSSFGYSITVENAALDGTRLMSWLSAKSVPVRAFTLRRASLEDIFLEEVNRNGH